MSAETADAPLLVVEDIEAAFFFFFLGFGGFDAVHFGLVHDLDFKVGELGVNLIEVLGGDNAFGQGVVDVVVSQMTLFLGKDEQLADFFREVNAGLGLDGTGIEARFRTHSFARSGNGSAILMAIMMMRCAVGFVVGLGLGGRMGGCATNFFVGSPGGGRFVCDFLDSRFNHSYLISHFQRRQQPPTVSGE